MPRKRPAKKPAPKAKSEAKELSAGELDAVTGGAAQGPASLGTKGSSKNMEMWAWHEAVLNGDIVAARKSS